MVAIRTIAWREILLYTRNKGRLLGSLGVPFFYLAILGFGLNSVLPVRGTDYFSFLVPGIIAMIIMFQSVFSALSTVTERQFGFLKEMLVAPISRTDIVLGKTLGNSVTAVFQGILVFVIAWILGFHMTQPIWNLVPILLIMFMTAIAFVAMGLSFASRINDPQVFQVLFNFVIMPLFLLSGAMFPLETAPPLLQSLAVFDPLTHAIDLLRWLFLGINHSSLFFNLTILLAFDLALILIASRLFNKAE